jgi:hypothetical protein
LTAYRDPGAGRELAKTVNLPLYCVGGTAEVASLDSTVHIDDALYGVMCHDGRVEAVTNRRDISQKLYRWA